MALAFDQRRVSPIKNFDCAVCAHQMAFFDRALVMQTHTADFYRCANCGLIAAPDPSWLDEAYASAIYTGDVGLQRRCRVQSLLTSVIIRSERLRGETFLDWAGGHGDFTKMMRDRGHDYYTWDGYASNLLAKNFDGDPRNRYSLVTAFEVMEHLVDPVGELTDVAANNELILFSTQLQPATPPRPADWWYYLLDSGQHVSLHTQRSLELLGQRLGYQLLTNGDQYHLFHRNRLRGTTRLILSREAATLKRTIGGVRRLTKQVYQR